MTAEEHLSQMMGATIANLMVQIAVLRAELDRVRGEAASNGQPAPAAERAA